MKSVNHYFTLPNEIFCLGLSSGEIAVYSYLLRCENRKTYQCYPSYRTIGQALKMSQNTVRKYVQSLEDKHLISTERTEVITKDGRKRNGTLGHVAMCKRIMKNQTMPTGDVPFYKIGTFGKKADAFISYELFLEYRKKYSYPKEGAILISASGTIGRTVVYDGKPAYYQDSNIVWLEHDEAIVLNKYLYYCYKLKPWNVSDGGTISRLYNDNILKAKVPIPYPEDTTKSLAEQQRIVTILDRFDKLCNDISEGLPAEIEARKKQYEYYRDKLLTFKKKEATINE